MEEYTIQCSDTWQSVVDIVDIWLVFSNGKIIKWLFGVHKSSWLITNVHHVLVMSCPRIFKDYIITLERSLWRYIIHNNCHVWAWHVTMFKLMAHTKYTYISQCTMTWMSDSKATYVLIWHYCHLTDGW